VHAGIADAEIVISSVPDSLLKGTTNEKLVRHVRVVNPTAKIIATAEELADTQILYAAGADYVTLARLDQANELDSVRELLDRDADARSRRLTLVTGAGFGVLATEALVIQLRSDRPPAARAVVAAVPAVQGLGSSVLASAVDVIAYGGRRYHKGRLERRRLGADHVQIPIPNGSPRGALGVPTGELEAARRASGAGEVVAYSSEVPNGRFVRAALPAVSAALAVRPIRASVQRVIGRMRLTPPATNGDVSWAYARLEWADGTRREAWLRTGEGYTFTARVAASVATRLVEGSGRPGAFTPGALFGAELARLAGAEMLSSNEVGA